MPAVTTSAVSDPPPALPGIRESILDSFRRNRVAFLGLNLVVACLLLTYSGFPAVRELWEQVGALKVRMSYGFSFLATVIAAALVPALVEWGSGKPVGGLDRWRRLFWSVIFWGYRGMEIDLFYRIQARVFGQGTDWRTLLAKLAVDQFLYSTLWAVPTYLVFLRWVDAGGRGPKLRESLDRRFWCHTYPTVLITNWMVWIPAVALVYSLPSPLQFPIFAVIMSFFVLLITMLARRVA